MNYHCVERLQRNAWFAGAGCPACDGEGCPECEGDAAWQSEDRLRRMESGVLSWDESEPYDPDIHGGA